MDFILKGIIFLLVSFIIFQLIRVVELSSKLSGQKDEITDQSNNINGWLSLLFGIGYMVFFYLQVKWWNKLTLQAPASEHGVPIDKLWDTTMGLILIVCLLLQPILFFFIWKFRGNKKRKAAFITHNNKVEIFWTAIPTIVLSGLIFFGLKVWGDVTAKPSDNALVIELYARQFDWTARYAGYDEKLGAAHVSAIHEDIENPSANNPLGVITNSTMNTQIDAITKTIIKDTEALEKEHNIVNKKLIESRLKENIERKKRYETNLFSLDSLTLSYGEDDILIPSGAGKLVLPVNKEVVLKFRSQDVIHSAYLPHFRVQMNCVPGLSTQFAFTPTKTTKEYQEYLQDPTFTYILLCNKICGNSHYNMYMEVEVVTQEKFEEWEKEQTVKIIANKFNITEEEAESLLNENVRKVIEKLSNNE